MRNGTEISRTALLLLDLQVGILGSLPEAGRLVERAAGAVQFARQFGLLVCHVRVALTPADRAATPPRNRTFWKLAQSGLLAEGAAGSAIVSGIEIVEDDLFVTKKRVSAFSRTRLHESLQTRQIETLVIGGIHTSGAVLSTVRDAADHDYRVLVLRDVCADPRPDVHRLLLNDVFPTQADVLDLDSLSEKLTVE